MRAIIIATGLNADVSALNEHYPVPMLPLVDRPFIQHVVETLVDRKVTEFDFVLSHLPEKIERFLGDGARWGSRFQFHLARDGARPYNLLKPLVAGANETTGPVLLAHADRLPQLPETMNAAQEQGEGLYCLRTASVSPERYEWTGWAWLPPRLIAQLPGGLNEAEFESHLLSALTAGTVIEVPRVLSAQSYESLLSAHAAVLAKEFPGLMLSASEIEPGIWLSRNVSLPPTAKLIAPVYVGENCRVGVRTELGPNVTVGNNCVLDAHCTAANSVIFPGSYIGEALELEQVIVDKNLLVNARLGAAVPVADDFILGSLSDHHIRMGVSRLLSRLAAVALLGITWPVLLITALYLKLTRPGPVRLKRECVKLPCAANETRWRTFQLWSFQTERESDGAGPPPGKRRWSELFLRFLPALINIAKGELSFVGVSPRTKTAVKLLPHDWQVLYLQSKAGIVTEAEVLYGTRPNEDELYSAEAFYSASAGVRHDLKLLLHYFSL